MLTNASRPLADPEGIEPSSSGLEADVLPLHQGPVKVPQCQDFEGL